MPIYRYKGVKVEAQTPEAAKALVLNKLAGGEVDPTEGMSTGEEILAGTGSGLTNILRQTTNMVLPEAMQPDWATDEAIAEQARLDAPLMKTGGGMGGRVLGEVAGAALPGGAAMRGARMLGATGKVLPLAVGAGTEGAIIGGPGERVSGAATGAALGGGIGAAAKGMTRLGRGMDIDPQARHLMRQGVELTPGQMRRGGIMDVFEQSASGRLSGTATMARGRAQEQTVAAMARRAVPQGARIKPDDIPIDASPQQASTMLKQAFTEAYDRVPDVRVSRIFGGGALDDTLPKIASNWSGLTDDVAKAESRWLKNLFSSLPPGTSVSAKQLLKIRSEIRKRAHQAVIAKEGDKASMLLKVADEVTQKVEGSMSDSARRLLRATDSKYGDLLLIENIAYRTGDGGITPNRISQAVKQSAPTRSTYARGGGRMRDMAEAQAHAFGTSIPPTGLANAAPFAAAGMGAAVGGMPGAVVGAALPSALTAFGASRLGRRLFAGQTSPQRALAKTMDLINRPIDTIGLGGSAAGLSYMNQE